LPVLVPIVELVPLSPELPEATPPPLPKRPMVISPYQVVEKFAVLSYPLMDSATVVADCVPICSELMA
jgi:hypothetical protein